MAQKKINMESLESLAAFSLAEVTEVFQTSERNVRRWVSDHGLFRRNDGLFPICTTAWWWLGDYQRRMDPEGDPAQDLLLLAVRTFGMLGFHKFNEDMLRGMEFLLRIPLSQDIFESLRSDWSCEIRGRKRK